VVERRSRAVAVFVCRRNMVAQQWEKNVIKKIVSSLGDHHNRYEHAFGGGLFRTLQSMVVIHASVIAGHK
jgi:hypothetical protein